MSARHQIEESCTSCQGRTTIVDPVGQEEEPCTCPDCGGSGKARDQIVTAPAPDPSIATRTYLPLLTLCRTCRRPLGIFEDYTVVIGSRAESGYCRDCAAKATP